MILSLRTWWRILVVLGAAALLPLAWRGLEREPPILIQQVAGDRAGVPPGAVVLAQAPPGPPAAGAGAKVEAAGARTPGDPPEDGGSAAGAGDGSAPAGARELPCPESSEHQEPVPSPAGGAGAETPAGSDRPAAPATSASPRVNVNTADAAALETLPGIGPALAARIVAYRERWGPFTAPEQLMEVSGIGEKRLEQLLPWITLE